MTLLELFSSVGFDTDDEETFLCISDVQANLEGGMEYDISTLSDALHRDAYDAMSVLTGEIAEDVDELILVLTNKMRLEKIEKIYVPG